MKKINSLFYNIFKKPRIIVLNCIFLIFLIIPLSAVLLDIVDRVLYNSYLNQMNSWRLLPSFLLADFMPLYSTLSQGHYAFVLYGPLYPLFYIPTTLFDYPIDALVFGNILSLVILLLPCCLVIYEYYNNFIDKNKNFIFKLVFSLNIYDKC